MKITGSSSTTSVRRRGAFTLVEVLITMVTTVIVMGGTLAAYIYGLKMMQYVRPKLTASDDARKAVSLLTDEIRAAFDVKIGMRTGTKFQPVAPFALQQGNAICIYPTANTNQFVFYFWDVNDSKVKRTTNNATSTSVIAAAVTNQMVFAAEDFQGRILTNAMNNRVISATLQFYQIQYPTTAVGPGNYYDWYQVQCRVTKRTLD